MDDLLKTESGIYLPPSYNYYIKPTERDISQRKLEGLQKLAEIKQWGLKNPTRFLKEFIGVELLDNQQYVFMNSWSKPFCLWLESRAAGKMLDLNTRIPTPDGDVTIGDLKVGDTIFGDDGKPTKVVYLSPIKVPEKTYMVEFEDGEKIHACSEHLWSVYSYGRECVKTTEELAKDYVKSRKQKQRKDGRSRKEQFNEYKYRVKLCKPLEYEEKKLPINPYILGLWLGDGAVYDGTLTSHIDDYKEIIKHIESSGYIIHSIRNDRDTKKRINVHNADDKPLLSLLRENGLLSEKHIPSIYMQSSIEQRLELLRGLMDSDGSIDTRGRCEFSQSSEKHNRLLKDMSALLDSLGIKHSIKYSIKTCQTGQFNAGRIYFITDTNMTCFKLQRKCMRLREKLPKCSSKKSIVNITEVPSVPMRCIQVDNSSHLYLCGERNTITHNTTMLALYAMTKGLLLNNYRIYICSGTADQSQETFRKIEDIALKNIESMTGLTDVFKYEVEVNQANSNGFIHNPMGFTYSLYNGSFVKTLNSNINAKRGLSIRQRIAGFFIIQKWIMFHAESLAS